MLISILAFTQQNPLNQFKSATIYYRCIRYVRKSVEKVVEQTLGWSSWTNSSGEARDNLAIKAEHNDIRLAEAKLYVYALAAREARKGRGFRRGGGQKVLWILIVLLHNCSITPQKTPFCSPFILIPSPHHYTLATTDLSITLVLSFQEGHTNGII